MAAQAVLLFCASGRDRPSTCQDSPMRLPALCCTLAALTCPVQAADRPAAQRHRQVDALFAAWNTPASPGCAIGVSRDGKLEYARGYGMANLEYGIPITPQSVFHASSMAKQFTAFAIGLLAQDGKLALGDDIRRYLPEMADIGQAITIAQLVHHTDGLREQGQLLNLAGWRGDDLYTQDDILWVLARQRSLNFTPGAEVVYGNAAYTLLTIIVQRVAGQSLRAFADARIFAPLGMQHTYFRDDHTETKAQRASAYNARAGGGWSIGVPNIDHHGSTSLQSTVGDLLKWEQNLVDHRIGGAALGTWMRTSGALNDGTPVGYAGGLRVGSFRGLALVSHDGADGGYRSDGLLFPDQRLAIVALCNGGTIAPAALTRRVAEIYLGGRMTTPALIAPVPVPASAQAAWAGTWWSAQTDEIVRLAWRDGALRQPGNATPLVPLGDGVFRPLDLAHTWRFTQDGAGATLHIRDFWPTERQFARIDDALPDAPALAAFAGVYHSTETDTRYTVKLVEGRLALTWPRGYDVALDAVGGDRFTASLGTVTFTRDAGGAVGGVMISNRRLRRFVAQRYASN
jgi:CubicO group peptidase (beta-lactamase class C family)